MIVNKYKVLVFVFLIIILSKSLSNAQIQEINSNVFLSIGYANINDVKRDEQVNGNKNINQSYTIRPFFNDSTYNQKKKLYITILPINILQKYNSNRPYGWNDGPLSFSKGYQALVSGGVIVKYRQFETIIQPEIYHTASGEYRINSQWGQITEGLNKISSGQSSLSYFFGKHYLIASTRNFWLGPGRYNSLTMSNNAKGFKHIGIGSKKPLQTKLGQLEYLFFSGALTTLSNQGFENNNLKTKPFDGKSRYINGLTISFMPNRLKGFYIGFNRVFQTYFTNLESSNQGVLKYAMVFNGLFKTNYNDDRLKRDQVLSIFSRWVMPKEKAEVYFEYGYNDAKSNIRDLILDNSHASASIFGVRKFFSLNKTSDILLEAESTRMAQTPSYLQRTAGNWYIHGEVEQGYTNNNQVMGSGSGLGNNVQTFSASWISGLTKIGLQFQKISQNPTQKYGNANNLFVRDVLWNDYSIGAISRFKIKNILFNGSVEHVKSKNYLWESGLITNNLYVYISSIILL